MLPGFAAWRAGVITTLPAKRVFATQLADFTGMARNLPDLRFIYPDGWAD
jgi:hypothetical protein